MELIPIKKRKEFWIKNGNYNFITPIYDYYFVQLCKYSLITALRALRNSMKIYIN